MPYYIQMEGCTVDQLVQFWLGDTPSWAESRESFLDEVAYGLTNFDPQGVVFLISELESTDSQRRKSALTSLAYPEFFDQEIENHLLDCFVHAELADKMIALWGFINSSHFPLQRKEVEALTNGSDGRVAASAMVYLSRAFDVEAISLLREGLESENPRKREYACDEVGDRFIQELAEDIAKLINDPDPHVSQAAKANYEMLT